MKKTNISYTFFLLFFTTIIHAYWAEQTLETLSLHQKIGQLFMVATGVNLQQLEESLASEMIKSPYKLEHKYIEQLIKEYHIGGIIFLFKGSINEQISLTNRFQAISDIPLLIGQDCEWGLSMRLYDTIRFPKNMTLGALPNKELIYKVGKEIGQQCKAIGVHINFAPVVDVNTNSENPVIHLRSFGDDKYHVAECGIAFMRGLQDAGILTCAKHFPGHGDTFQDSHVELPTVAKTKNELYEEELYPFKKLIDAGVDCVMNAHLKTAFDKQRNLPSSLSSKVVTNLLRNELEFNGLAITDDMGMKGITKYHKPGQAELKALLAGNDIILCPVDVPKAVELIEQALVDGKITEQELDARVLKILKAKEQLNLHENRLVDDATISDKLHSPDAYALKQQLYQQAITLKNCKNVLPLKADNYASTALVQIGGYLPSEFEKTLQGTNIATYHLPAQAQKELIQFVLSKLTDKKTIIIALFDMNNKANESYGINESSLNLVDQLRNQNKKIILTIFGTPYSLAFFDENDPCIMAYEDDTDAQKAAAQVILGQRKANGILPICLE